MRSGMKALCALLLAPASAMAQDGFLDLFYVPKAEIELTDSSGSLTFGDGTGFGLRGRAMLEGGLFLQGEFQANEYDSIEDSSGSADFRSETKILRGGFGITAGESPLYGMLEFIKQELELTDACPFVQPCSFDDTGYGVHVGLQSRSETSQLYGQVGLVDVGDFGNGIEFLVGGAINFSPTSAVFVEYRSTTQEDDSGAEAEFTDFRAGLRLRFGR